ncbi:MAG TPA: hypothetical protein VL693_07365 [Vicinamibacterales bacterium]|jgi:hypothetical protein|nr:hypothetical protein [Vicinamibacterales bacterium]
MKRSLRLSLSILVPAAVLAILLPSSRTTVSAAPTPPVTPVLVTNTTDQPVPTVAQGTTAVSGNVGITGTPTVGLAGGSQVTIANTSPLLIRDFDRPAAQPFNYFDGDGAFVPGFTAANPGGIAFTVPSGKRLVIEFVSMFAQIPQGQNIVFGRVDTTGQFIYLPMTHTGTFTQAGEQVEGFVGSQRMFVVLEPGTQVDPTAARDSGSGSGLFQVQIAGYYVNVS